MDKFQFEVVFFINDDLMMIKYNPKLSNKLLSIIKEEEKDISIKKGFASKKRTLSNIAIAAFISAYGRVHLNKFRLITDIVYTDTDSIFTENPIDPKYIGPEIGQLKLESNIIKGFFIIPKFYSYLTDKGKEVVVTAGVKASLFNLSAFEFLYLGLSITLCQENYLASWNTIGIKFETLPYTVTGLKNPLGIKSLIPFKPWYIIDYPGTPDQRDLGKDLNWLNFNMQLYKENADIDLNIPQLASTNLSVKAPINLVPLEYSLDQSLAVTSKLERKLKFPQQSTIEKKSKSHFR